MDGKDGGQVPEKIINCEYNWRLPNEPSRCVWTPNSADQMPHLIKPFEWKTDLILSSPLELIGQTPLVRLRKIPSDEGLKCEFLAKLEYCNPGGSSKDRIALRMIEEAERTGRLSAGGTIVESSSGNTAIGLALVARVKGYRCLIVLREKSSLEKEKILKALGAEVIRNEGKHRFDDPNSDMGIARRLAAQIPGACYMGQYQNKDNPLAHYETTAEELISQCDGKIDMVVVGSGTGGTLTGIGRRLKTFSPEIQLIGVDPEGSIVGTEEPRAGGYEVEGIGRKDFIPTCLDRQLPDRWIQVPDGAGFQMARRLVLDEGLLAGGSSGHCVSAAVLAAKHLSTTQRCVVILPDDMRNYLSKVFDDDWMKARGFL